MLSYLKLRIIHQYPNWLFIVIVLLLAVGAFSYQTFIVSGVKTKAAIESTIHIEAESTKGNVKIFSDSKASNGKFIRFEKVPATTVTPSISNTKVPTPTSGPTTTLPPIQVGKGIWISKEEIMSLPTTGTAWTTLVREANSNWGSANLGDNNSSHDVKTLAGALVAVRTNDEALRQKTIEGLQSAMKSPLSRALELSRGLQTYIIAADIIGYRTPEFEQWIRSMLNANVSPHTGGSKLCNQSGVELSCSGIGGVLCTAYRSPNNWGGHARASAIAGALYLNDQQLTQKLVNAHKAFIGIDVSNNLYCQDTNWHANSANRYGVNKKGSSINGTNVSGVLPEDWRRGAEYKWPPAPSGYMWEGMQGYVVSAVMLHRAGLVSFNAGDNAVVRSMDMLYAKGEAASNSPQFSNPAGSDDTWIPWVINYYAGTNYPTSAASSGKNMGYTDWTHQNTNVRGDSDQQVMAENSCPTIPSGMTNSSIEIFTQEGLYKVWSRMRSYASGGNAYYFQIDDKCPVLVGNSPTLSSDWTWVNYKDGNPNSIHSVQLSEGSHTMKLFGAEEGVDVDKIILTQTISCIPEGSGTNCDQNTVSATVTPDPGGCPDKKLGDANCDNQIDDEDFLIWKDEYVRKKSSKTADFDHDQHVAVRDFEIWRQNFRQRDE